MKKACTRQHTPGGQGGGNRQGNDTVRRRRLPAICVVLVACVLLARTTLALEFENAFQKGPVCWHYVNSEGEEFLLKLRTLSLGRTSFIVSGVLAGTGGGQYPIFGNAELLKGRVKSSLVLNDAYPTIATSTFLSGVLFIVDLDPETLNGVFEWISPTLSGPDPNGLREFQAFSLRGTLTFLSNRLQCEQLSQLPAEPAP
jgi:hypothetical protein